jgi:GTP-binding protein LepA
MVLPPWYCRHGTALQVDSLYAGEVGYLAASIKQVADARVGDTITLKKQPAAEALPGYTEVMPMVFCGLFPTGWWA